MSKQKDADRLAQFMGFVKHDLGKTMGGVVYHLPRSKRIFGFEPHRRLDDAMMVARKIATTGVGNCVRLYIGDRCHAQVNEHWERATDPAEALTLSCIAYLDRTEKRA